MQISYDQAKRDWTLKERGVDFDETPLVFAGLQYTMQDDRQDYGEIRYITVGFLRGRMMVIVWTARGQARHIISFRRANDREKEKYENRMGRP